MSDYIVNTGQTIVVRVPASQSWQALCQQYEWSNGAVPIPVQVWAYSQPTSVVTFTAGQFLNTAILAAGDIQNFLNAGIITQVN